MILTKAHSESLDLIPPCGQSAQRQFQVEYGLLNVSSVSGAGKTVRMDVVGTYVPPKI